ncbi:MAG TPA: hypothetical protein DDX91_10125 [Ruminococcaceae bacterium]|nr:hypothetical protein [Oscillospiraceae bacterium]
MAVGKLSAAYQNPIKYTPNKFDSDSKQTKPARTDTLTLTREAQQYLERTNKNKNEAQEGLSDDGQEKNSSLIQMDFFIKQLQETKENKSSSRVMDLAKCMKIARRIMHGDRVPMKDQKFLAEKFPDLFRNAIMFKQHNPEPKKYKSILDKDDEENSQNQSMVNDACENSNESFLASALEGLGE